MNAAEREKVVLWLEWYTQNRPRHEGSADVQRQLAFVMKAFDGVFATLARLAAEDVREGAAHLPGHRSMNSIIRGIAEDALVFRAPDQTPVECLQGVIERLAMMSGDRVTERLRHTVLDAQRRLLLCPAVKGRRKRPCGTWFVSLRASHVYCSYRCAHATFYRARRARAEAAR